MEPVTRYFTLVFIAPLYVNIGCNVAAPASSADLRERRPPTHGEKWFTIGARTSVLRLCCRGRNSSVLKLSSRTDTQRLQDKLQSIINRETIGLREFLNNGISEEAWKVIKSELQYRRQTPEAELANLERSQDVILRDLNTALEILPHLSELHAKVEPKDQRKLLELVLKRVVIDEQGTIREVELLPPFIYNWKCSCLGKKTSSS